MGSQAEERLQHLFRVAHGRGGIRLFVGGEKLACVGCVVCERESMAQVAGIEGQRWQRPASLAELPGMHGANLVFLMLLWLWGVWLLVWAAWERPAGGRISTVMGNWKRRGVGACCKAGRAAWCMCGGAG